MIKIPTRHLLLVNGLLWLAVGTRILLIGIVSFLQTRVSSVFLLSLCMNAETDET